MAQETLAWLLSACFAAVLPVLSVSGPLFKGSDLMFDFENCGPAPNLDPFGRRPFGHYLVEPRWPEPSRIFQTGQADLLKVEF